MAKWVPSRHGARRCMVAVRHRVCVCLLQLRDILEAFVCLRPDVGYVQGMSYLGAVICLYVDSP
jgi:hypothetical protein